jgi:hypothetical protein
LAVKLYKGGGAITIITQATPFDSVKALSYGIRTGLIQVNFDKIGPSPYIFQKVDMNLDIAA